MRCYPAEHPMSTNTILLPFTLALLATAACGGSTTSGNNDDTKDSGTTTQDSGQPAQDSGGTTGDSGVAGDTGTQVDSGTVEVDGGTFVAVPLDVCGPALQYTATATIGATQQFQLAIDTGSGSVGVAGSSCSTCGVSPEWTPDSTATDEHQTVNAMYESGGWVGEIYQDNVSLDPSMAVPLKFGAMTSQSQFFEPTQCQIHSGGVQGIVGFGPTASAFPGTNGFFDIYAGTEMIPDLFAMSLCDTGGTLWLGGFDGTAVAAPPQWTAMMPGQFSLEYYLIDFESMTIGTTNIQIANGSGIDSLVDTGTSIFVVPTMAYQTITSAVEATPYFQTAFGANASSLFANSDAVSCAQISATKADLDANLPPLTLTFGTGASAITINAKATDSYLYSAGNQQWCSGIAGFDMGGGPPATLGAPILKSNVVIWDRGNQRIGFAPHADCP